MVYVEYVSIKSINSVYLLIVEHLLYELLLQSVSLLTNLLEQLLLLRPVNHVEKLCKIKKHFT